MKLNRRKFISRAGAGAALTVVWPFLPACENASSRANKPGINNEFKPDLDLEFSAVEREISILSGKKTRVWVFESQVISGESEAVQSLEGSYLGPVIKLRRGQKARIRFKNRLPEESIVHWHGMHVPEQYDGHPKDVIDTGETYIYEFEVMNRAGTYWYHPHPHGRTGPQVYYGLAGLLLVTDEKEKQLELPQGEFDIPVVIQDRSFDSDNQLVYLDGSRMSRMHGFLGGQILINGNPAQELNLKAGCAYRLRLLNGSNSRIYKLAWEDGSPLTVFGIDGSLLNQPKELPYLMLGPAKRADLWVDLKSKPEGARLAMHSQYFPLETMSSGMMGGGGMMGEPQTSLPHGGEYPVFTIIANTSGSNDYTLKDELYDTQLLNPSSANNMENPRQFVFAMDHMEWTINGRTWETYGVSGEEKVALNTTEVWELINSGSGMMGSGGMMDRDGGMMGDGGGMMDHHGGMMEEEENTSMQGGMMGNMMAMPHPVHIHQVQFNILERNADEVDPELWRAIKDGFVDEGWQDTVLLMPGMRTKVIMQFRDFTGLFVYHCHNLEHEDMGMMRNFEIS
ncbi:MAG: multicopper oxidase family protein [Lewinellaceae bacterium]|nr:multicopper oxidase family protein [Lewinellaceae bacterium]